MNQIYLDQDQMIFKFRYDPQIVEDIKISIRGRRWDPALKVWTAPAAKVDDKILERFRKAYGFMVDKKIGLPPAVLPKVPPQIKTDYKLPPGVVKGTLREYQLAGVEYALNHPKCLIADEMGTGKTLQSLAAVTASDSFPALVICPASLKYNWQREINKWIEGKSVRILSSGDSIWELVPFDFHVVNYDILGKINFANIQFKSVICDESHYLKSASTLRSDNVQKILKGVERAIFLSGTPILNRPSELVNQLKLLGVLDKFGGYWKFVRRYCRAYHSNYGINTDGAANLDELSIRLKTIVMIRREKSEVVKELPEKIRSDIEVEIDNMREYKSAEDDIVEFIRREKGDAASARAAAAETLVRIEKLKQLSTKGKMKAAVTWLEDFIETGKKIVVFVTHTDAARELAAKFNWPKIIGETPAEERQRAVDRFQDDPDLKGIVLNIKAGGVGLTLTAASDTLFLELGWSAGEMDQAEDRTHRIGQINSVTCHYFLGKGTIDETIYALIESKRGVYREAMGEKITVKTSKSIFSDLVRGMGGKDDFDGLDEVDYN